jgi:hypothetical protein
MAPASKAGHPKYVATITELDTKGLFGPYYYLHGMYTPHFRTDVYFILGSN